MHITHCPHGHEIRSSSDRDPQGYCLGCRRDGEKIYRSRRRAALELAQALEANGIPVMRSEPPVDVAALAAVVAAALQST